MIPSSVKKGQRWIFKTKTYQLLVEATVNDSCILRGIVLIKINGESRHLVGTPYTWVSNIQFDSEYVEYLEGQDKPQ